MSETTDPTTDEHDRDPDAAEHGPLERAEEAIEDAKGAASAATGHGATVGIPDDSDGDGANATTLGSLDRDGGDDAEEAQTED